MREIVYSKVFPPKSGLAIKVANRHFLRLTDLEGEQVVDTTVFNEHNLAEKLWTASSARVTSLNRGQPYRPRDHIEEGGFVMSTLCRPMMKIVKETVEPKGVYDANNRMCNSFLFEVFGFEPRDACQEIITKVIEPYGLGAEDIPNALNLMNYPHNCERGHFEILEPYSKPGYYIEFQAYMYCLVAFNSCPEDVLTDCNARHFNPGAGRRLCGSRRRSPTAAAAGEWLDRELRAKGLR